MSLLSAILAIVRRHVGTDSAVPRLTIHRLDHPTSPMPLVYDPIVCLVLQRTKRTVIGDRVLDYGAGSCLVVAAEVAALGQIVQATPEEPYLGLTLALDRAMLAEVLGSMAALAAPAEPTSFGIHEASPLMLDAWRRLAGLLDRPQEIPFLAPLSEQELLFRLLAGPQGAILRQIASADSHLSRIRRAMDRIRARYAERLSVEAMAEVAGMSASVFHRRFKAVTGLSPLQYQKHIRLHEAKRRLISGEGTAATVAFAVGYESASQFSREYRRLFGRPPGQDTARMDGSVEEVPVLP